MVLPMGRPMERASSSVSTRWTVDQMVVSVGIERSTTRCRSPTALWPRSTGSASPPHHVATRSRVHGGEQQAPGRRCRLHDRNRVLLQRAEDKVAVGELFRVGEHDPCPGHEWGLKTPSLRCRRKASSPPTVHRFHRSRPGGQR